ncbi:MAG: ornithine carbamoyltransferase [Actinomyces sp.]|jgi:ornithine carbamoyltransferase|nr:ornithine carbamoyltransferase [Actinomyces sp.]MCI1641856.1 ornithine carbamoyltransferase [Actinomyces sp.]MCI1662036.1 ornithine carbamoyltransferase [Actinomyces sp.]MCI1690764.1 ornithine carbamoyltransferase [Actinomyces sp.]
MTSPTASPATAGDGLPALFRPGQHLLKELDFAQREWRDLLDLAAGLKAAKREGREVPYLRGRNIALLFAKTSTRTRCAFEVAAADQGAHTVYLDPQGSQMGHKESVADTARVLGGMFDGIEYRGDLQSNVEILAERSGVPVFNGLTDDWHPTQMLADTLTMREHSGGRPDSEISYAYIGDARFNMGRSLLVNGAILGMDVRIIAPRELWPAEDVVTAARGRAAETGARITLTEDTGAVEGAGFVHTDIWVSMGEPSEAWAERIELLRDYRVDAALMDAAGPDAKFMHCLPSFHDLGTEVGVRIHEQFGLEGIEVSDEVFEGPRSIVFDQAANRMPTIKAAMVSALGRA